jgi:hypothetical protein
MAGHDAHHYRVADGAGLPHDPLNAIVGPRPIGWISSVGRKDSVANIEASGEFVWTLATRPLAEAMNEFVRGGLTPVPSTLIAPPRVLEPGQLRMPTDTADSTG